MVIVILNLAFGDIGGKIIALMALTPSKLVPSSSLRSKGTKICCQPQPLCYGHRLVIVIFSSICTYSSSPKLSLCSTLLVHSNFVDALEQKKVQQDLLLHVIVHLFLLKVLYNLGT